MATVIAWLSGLVFGLGLIVAGMTDPAKVKAFLDLAGPWDPSLALVMGAAVCVGVPAFAWARRHPRAWSGALIDLNLPTLIDGRLLLGALLFGAGWGVAGFCPGPALVALGLGGEAGRAALWFVPAMGAGMLLHDGIAAWRAAKAQDESARAGLKST